MRLVHSKIKIIEQEPGLLGVYKQIEKAGRVCYKSEDKITDDSAKKFVDMLIARGHTAPIEHGTIYLHFQITSAMFKYTEDYLKLMAIKEFYLANPYSKVVTVMSDRYSDDIYITTNARVILENNRQDDLNYICEPSEHHEKRITVKFICSRGIGNELVRHRTFSFCQESTRYCNYSHAKFGGDIQYVIPT